MIGRNSGGDDQPLTQFVAIVWAFAIILLLIILGVATSDNRPSCFQISASLRRYWQTLFGLSARTRKTRKPKPIAQKSAKNKRKVREL